MIASTRPNRTRQIRRSELEQFRRSIESWERHGREAGRDGDVELAAAYAEDVAELRAILRLIETGALSVGDVEQPIRPHPTSRERQERGHCRSSDCL